MTGTRKRDKKDEQTPNISAHYYTDPIYGSSSIYGIDDYVEDDSKEGSKQAKDEALDEPVESWGWINNVD